MLAEYLYGPYICNLPDKCPHKDEHINVKGQYACKGSLCSLHTPHTFPVSAMWSDHRRDPELISGLIVPVLSIVLRNSIGLMWLLCMLSFHFVSAPGFARLFGVGVVEEAVIALIWEHKSEQQQEDGCGSGPAVQFQVFAHQTVHSYH